MQEMKTKYLFFCNSRIGARGMWKRSSTASLNPNATLTTTASDNDIVLTEEMAGDEVLNDFMGHSWLWIHSFSFVYKIYMDKAGDFSDPKTVNVGCKHNKNIHGGRTGMEFRWNLILKPKSPQRWTYV